MGIEHIECPKFYTSQPAPVSVPDLLEQFAEFMAAESIKSGDYPDGWQSKASNAAHEYAQNIRAAMLQGAEPVMTAYKLPAIGWLRADYQDDNRGLRGNAPLFVLGKKDPSTVWGLDYIPLTSNSSVIPDGVCPCCGRKPLKNRTCSVSGCDGKHVARGFCIKHYAIERKKDPSRRRASAPQISATAHERQQHRSRRFLMHLPKAWSAMEMLCRN
ncbi:hypothetical protein AT292_25495 [Enterobacter cloacae]|nr:hypothetical protein AT292_25495 [Enterobacter cloacae]